MPERVVKSSEDDSAKSKSGGTTCSGSDNEQKRDPEDPLDRDISGG